MPAIHFDHVSFSYASNIDVLVDVCLHLGPGWTGLVGANGSGKSTLMSLAAGRLKPSTGRIRTEPAAPRPVVCPQEVQISDAAIEAFAIDTAGASRRWLGLLHLDPHDFGRWSTLSPGERKRWQVAAALAAEPPLLLLDEPTNHLDIQGRRVLVDALARFSGVGIVVSHDRSLLNELTTGTIRLEHGNATLWGGTYDVAKENWENLAHSLHDARDRASREQKKFKRRLADQRRAAEMKAARHKRSLRTAHPKNRDARSMAAKGRHQHGETIASRRVQVIRDAAERAASKVSVFETRRELGRSVFFDYQAARRRQLLSFEGTLTAGELVLVTEVSVQVGRDDRIRVSGQNGAGKSTLLSALVDSSDLPEGRLLHLPQELDHGAAAAAVERLHRLQPDRRGRVLNLVAALGVDPDRLLATGRPSPGEARKLVMAFGLTLSAWCLVLDEPTNHLDLQSVERLEEAVAAYPGAVVIVTHDDEFARRTTRIAWEITGGQITTGAEHGLQC
jgi:ATPase subunit of ABC transporter with duplicated ATPase domains